MNRREDLDRLYAALRRSRSTVFFGGAGVSTASGIPDFRGGKQTEPVEYYLSRDCLLHEPQRFFEHYRRRMLYPDAKPNAAHVALASLEAQGLLQTVITQNIDGLHQKAGSRHVLELHGTVSRCYCDRCGALYPPLSLDGTDIPTCDRASCRGRIRPDIVLYGEGLPRAVWDEAVRTVSEAELLLIGGTSLVVHPAASLIDCFAGKELVILNQRPTPYDSRATMLFRDSLTDILPLLAD